MSEKLVRKTHSKNYSTIIEVKIPTRFYWVNDNYDGLQFTVKGCTKHQVKLIEQVLKQLLDDMSFAKIARYLKENHREEWTKLLTEIEASDLKIPQAFLDAFKEEN